MVLFARAVKVMPRKLIRLLSAIKPIIQTQPGTPGNIGPTAAALTIYSSDGTRM
jgi:hypothetical protein